MDKSQNILLNTNLGNVCQITMGQSPPGSTYNKNSKGLPFFQGKTEFGVKFPSIKQWCTHPKKVAEPGDILLSVRAPVGPTNIAKVKSCIGRGLSALRADNKVLNQEYLFYFFKYIEPSFSLKGQGGIFKAISKGDIENLQFVLRPLSEQKRIVEILDQAEEIRQLRKQADEKSNEIISSLFYKMFGDLEKDTLLHEVMELKYGKGLPKSKRRKGNIPVYGSNGVVDYHDKHFMKNDTIIVGRKGSAGEVQLVRGASWPIDTTFYTEIIKNDVELEYLFFALKQLDLRKFAIITGVPGINRDTILNQKIAIPDPKLQSRFSRIYNQISDLNEKQQCSSNSIDSLYTNLLSKAFDGSLTERWREGRMKELLQEMEEQKKYLGIN